MQTTRMRRSKRHRWLTFSVLIIAYSVFQAVFSASTATIPNDTKTEDDGNLGQSTTNTSPPKTTMTEKPNEKISEETGDEDEVALKTPSEAEGENNSEENIDVEEEESKKSRKGFETKTEQKDQGYQREALPTTHPTRNCSPPAIEQFPPDLFGQTTRKHGGLFIHVLVAIFTFIGLAIVCDEYFVSSLDRICEELKLAPDVAGATFMAAGSSAPELATVVIGVFCAKDDIGVSGVIGSAVFNIMFVISVCALCAGTVSHLNWWPLCRDCFFYAISIFVMLCTTANDYVSWPEALFMLLMYGVYCVALHFNSTLEQWALKLPLPFKLPTREEQAALVTYKSVGGQVKAKATIAEGDYAQMEGETTETSLQTTGYNAEGAYDNAAYNYDPNQSWDPNQGWDNNQPQAWQQSQNAPQPAPRGEVRASKAPGQDHVSPSEKPTTPQQSTHADQQPAPAAPAYYKAKEYNPETAVDPLIKPVGANHLQLAYWYVAFPIHWSCRHSMPDSRGRWYPVTFLMSMLWISFYSYFMVWMITIIGYTLGIPDTVMGLTFVAAGVSVPDAISSLAVIKEGYGDMAVSNAVGSNVFDILVCLGLPWFLQTAIIHPGSHVNVISKGLWYSTLSLLSTVVFLVVATHANGWKLDRKYGIVLMVWYLLFITFASLYEFNIISTGNKQDCTSDY